MVPIGSLRCSDLSGKRWSSPIRNGRLRDLDWPYGLRSIVLIGYVGFGVAAVIGGLVRTHSPAQQLDRLRHRARVARADDLATGRTAVLRRCVLHVGSAARSVVAQAAWDCCSP